MIYANEVCGFYLEMRQKMEKGAQREAIKAGLLCAVALRGVVIQERSYPLEDVFCRVCNIVTIPAEVCPGITYNTAEVSDKVFGEWSEKLLKEIEHMFEEGVMFNYPAASLMDILRKSGFCTMEFFTKLKDYMFSQNQPFEYVKSILTYVPKRNASGIEFYVESASYKKYEAVTGCVPFDKPLLIEGFGDMDVNAFTALAKKYPGVSEPSSSPFRWLIAMRESIDGSTSDELTYSLMAGMKTILAMCGLKDLQERDILKLYEMCRGQQIKYPRHAYINFPEEIRHFIKYVADGGNIMIGNRHTMWKWLNKLYKQLLS